MSRLERAVIQPPLVQPENHPIEGYILHPDLDGIRALVRDLMSGRAGRSPQPLAAPEG